MYVCCVYCVCSMYVCCVYCLCVLCVLRMCVLCVLRMCAVCAVCTTYVCCVYYVCVLCVLRVCAVCALCTLCLYVCLSMVVALPPMNLHYDYVNFKVICRDSMYAIDGMCECVCHVWVGIDPHPPTLPHLPRSSTRWQHWRCWLYCWRKQQMTV